MQTQSPFFRLPSELRQQIYRLHLQFTRDKFIMAKVLGPDFDPFFFSDDHNLSSDGAATATTLLRLMTACKRLYHDLAPLVFGEAAVAMFSMRYHRFDKGRRSFILAKSGHAPLRLSRLHKLVVMTNSRHNAEWGNLGWGANLARMLDGAPELRHLVLEMHAMPVRVADVDRWLDAQADTLLPLLRRLPRLERVVFRSSFPACYRSAYVPEVLVEFLGGELGPGVHVVASELGERWSVGFSAGEFALRVRGEPDGHP